MNDAQSESLDPPNLDTANTDDAQPPKSRGHRARHRSVPLTAEKLAALRKQVGITDEPPAG